MNGRHYYCVAYCEKHGFLKGKIRIHKTEDNRIFVVKTTKLIPKEEVDVIADRQERAKEMRKRRRHS